MLRVTAQPEPASFDIRVRRKGLAYLDRKGVALDQPIPSGLKLGDYWRDCLDELYDSYGGICAYLAIYFERITGGASVDHFIAKSSLAGQAYEWGNYRLACTRMNSRKRNYADVLDPFCVEEGWFRLELITGHIYPNPEIGPDVRESVAVTIERLKLDDAGCREIRARHFSEYIEKMYTADFLRRRSPFVWYEAYRQGLL